MRPALIIGGVCLAGKTSLANAIAARASFRVEMLEGDELHSAVAIAKMRAGQPLNEADREKWRARICVRIAQRPSDCLRVITCSALTKFSRDTLRSHGDCRFVFLMIPRALAELRAARRLMDNKDHFFQPAKYPALLDGQFRDLEIPGPEESDCTVVDAEEFTVNHLADQVLNNIY